MEAPGKEGKEIDLELPLSGAVLADVYWLSQRRGSPNRRPLSRPEVAVLPPGPTYSHPRAATKGS